MYPSTTWELGKEVGDWGGCSEVPSGHLSARQEGWQSSGPGAKSTEGLFYLMANLNAYPSFRVNEGLNTFFGKECARREAHWLNTRVLSRCLISMENSQCLCYVTHGPQLDVQVTHSRIHSRYRNSIPQVSEIPRV